MYEWENMMYFAIEMIKHAKQHNSRDIINERIVIVSLDQATELLIKSFLLEKGYFINKISKKKTDKGIKNGVKVETLLDKNRTIGFIDALNLADRLLKLSRGQKAKIVEFHKLRNEIQHRGLYIELNKREAIVNFCPALTELYKKMFPKYADAFPELDF